MCQCNADIFCIILSSIFNIRYALRMLCTCDRQARREHMHFEYDVFDSGPDRPDRQTSTDIDRSISLGIPRPHKAHGKPEALMECPSLRSYMILHIPTFDSLPSSLQAKGNKLMTFASKISIRSLAGAVVTFRRCMKDGESMELHEIMVDLLPGFDPGSSRKSLTRGEDEVPKRDP